MHTIPLDRLPLSPGVRALDLGCGRGRHAHALGQTPGLLVVGADMDAEDLAATAGGFEMFGASSAWGVTRADARRLPFADEAFDIVICSEVLEHIIEWEDALAEITRVTRRGGVFALSVPRAWPEAICWRLAPEYPKEPGGHVRIFHAGALRRAVEAKGFRRVWSGFAHGLHSPYWWLKCLWWSRRDDHPVIRAYQRFLEWDILKRPLLTRALEAVAAPIMGKSVVMHFVRDDEADAAGMRA